MIYGFADNAQNQRSKLVRIAREVAMPHEVVVGVKDQIEEVP